MLHKKRKSVVHPGTKRHLYQYKLLEMFFCTKIHKNRGHSPNYLSY
jgi:hypothetical protein